MGMLVKNLARSRIIVFLLFLCAFLFVLFNFHSNEQPSDPKKLEFVAEGKKPKQEVLVDKDAERANAFKNIYDTNYWGDPESRSGDGSTVKYTARARKFISTIWKIYGAKTFLDSPCGDCNWQPLIPGFEKIQYTGIDIVAEAIRQNARKYMNKPNMRFINIDMVADAKLIPKNHFDVVMCRDVIQHLPLEDGLKIYKTFEDIGAKVLITNLHIQADSLTPNPNTKIEAGAYYANNPLLPPFNFSLPMFYTVDSDDAVVGRTGEIKIMAAFELPVLNKGDGQFGEEDRQVVNIEAAKKGIIAVGDRAKALLEAVSK